MASLGRRTSGRRLVDRVGDVSGSVDSLGRCRCRVRPCLVSATGPPQLDRFEPSFNCSRRLRCCNAAMQRGVLKHSQKDL